MLIRFILSLIFLILISGCGDGFKAREFCSGTYNVKARLPLVFEITTSMDSMHRVALLDAAIAIESQTGLRLFSFTLVGSAGKIGLDGHNQVMVFNSSWPFGGHIQGQTTIHWNGENIVNADIYVNAVNYTYFTGMVPNYSKVSLESLYIHEMLHALGLVHNENAGSVMNSSLAFGQIRTTLSAEDVAAIRCLYQ